MPGDRYFLDTNVLVYANDSSDERKKNAAVQLIADGIRSGLGVISSQVLSEFWVTVTQKIHTPLDRETAGKEIEHFRALQVVSVEYDSVKAAIRLQARHQLAYWDALILATAVLSGCGRLFSEDMGEGRHYDGVVVVDPFAFPKVP
ncbi:MAG: PIN domain-containing protein [Spirochaetes bacterium]|nr:PIN domain-containing protein [Spirochaetota bacterium]